MARSNSTALAGLIVSVVVTAGFSAGGLYFYHDVEATPEVVGRPGLRHQLEMKQAELRDEISLRDREQARLDGLRCELAPMFDEYRDLSAEVERFRLAAAIFGDRRQTGDAEAKRARAAGPRLAGEKDQYIRELVELREAIEKEQDKIALAIKAAKDEVKKDIAKEEERRKRLERERRRENNIIQTEIAGARDMLMGITARAADHDAERAESSPDGRLLRIDGATGLAVLDVGRAQGVEKGFIFEVFQIKSGRRVLKGRVEVRTVGETTSTARVSVEAVRLPRCHASGYTAAEPWERFSPYDSGGAGGLKVARLLGRPKEAVRGMNPDDPMVRGDLIHNPFFDADRPLRVAVQGDDYIVYSPDEIRAAVRRHGGIVDDEVTAATDCLVSLRWPGDDDPPPLRKARELGVPVIHEFELFGFLGR